MSKPKQTLTLNVTTIFLILVALLYLAIVLLTEQSYIAGVNLAFGSAVIIILVIMILTFVVSGRNNKVRKVYLLYAQEDLSFVAELYKALKIAPYRIIWDQKAIQVGDHIEAKRNQLFKESDDIVVVISKHSLSSEESRAAISKAINLNKRILPVLIDDSELPDELKEIKYADFRASFDDGYFSLRWALKAD